MLKFMINSTYEYVWIFSKLFERIFIFRIPSMYACNLAINLSVLCIKEPTSTRFAGALLQAAGII